jgi:hypothetical protein
MISWRVSSRYQGFTIPKHSDGLTTKLAVHSCKRFSKVINPAVVIIGAFGLKHGWAEFCMVAVHLQRA